MYLLVFWWQVMFLDGGTFLEAKLSAAQTNSVLSKIGQLSYGSF
jgi:hypothetical protein